MDTQNHALKNADLLATSLHFWWVAYLRSSRDFWWICQEQGKCLDQRLVKVWEDFGDLCKYETFSQWWIAKGTKLFDSPQIEMELVKFLSAGVELLLTADLKRAKPGMICLAIPLNIKVSTANEILTKLFETARLRGKHYDRDAKYQILKGGNEKCYHSIKPAYLTNALRVCIDHSAPGDSFSRWGNYQMSKFLELCPQHHPRDGDSVARTKKKQKAMRTKNSQAYGMATKLIANVEIGRFPSSKKVESSLRWTADQQKALNEAVGDGQWQRANWFEQEHDFMLPAHVDQDTNGEITTDQRYLNLLTDLRLVDQSYFSVEDETKNPPTQGPSKRL